MCKIDRSTKMIKVLIAQVTPLTCRLTLSKKAKWLKSHDNPKDIDAFAKALENAYPPGQDLTAFKAVYTAYLQKRAACLQETLNLEMQRQLDLSRNNPKFFYSQDVNTDDKVADWANLD